MAIWQQEEGNTDPIQDWYLNLLKRSGFDVRLVVNDGRQMFAATGEARFVLQERCVEVIGALPTFVELRLLKKRFQRNSPYGHPIHTCDPDDMFRGLSNQLVVTTKERLAELGTYFREHAHLEAIFAKLAPSKAPEPEAVPA